MDVKTFQTILGIGEKECIITPDNLEPNPKNPILRPLLDAGKITMTIPDKPKSQNQRYVITENK